MSKSNQSAPHLSWVPMLTAQVLASRAKETPSPWKNISDALYGDAIELAIERLEKRGEYREPFASEVDSALEDLMTDDDYTRRCS